MQISKTIASGQPLMVPFVGVEHSHISLVPDLLKVLLTEGYRTCSCLSKMLPFEIQEEIMKRLPVRSLIQFRLVSKAWKSLIDSSHFIACYSGQMQHLCVRYYVGSVGFPEHVSIADDDSFPKHRVFLTLPLFVNLFKFYRIIGSSHGLLCLYGYFRRGHDFSFLGKHMTVLWNISIRKAVVVVEPDVGDEIYTTVIGFGVCRETIDPKIVKIKHIYPWSHLESGTCIPWQVEVFALSTGVWRSPYNNPPRKSIEFVGLQVVVDGSLYWLATDAVRSYGEFRSYNLIISFDITSERFREVKLSNSLAHHSIWNLSVSKLRESLVVTPRDRSGNDCIGAIDGTHIRVKVPSKDASRYRGRKGYPTITVLAACTFDLKFTYVLSGWEGTASDSRVLKDALTREDKLNTPDGKFYLVDGGLPLKSTLIAPYRGVRYHLKEYSKRAPQNPRELFNLRHASLRNSIERAFGILKRRFPIIRSTTEPFYSCETQSQIFLACCILHNYLLEVDRDRELEDEVAQEVLNATQDVEDHAPNAMDDRGEQIRESIANEMWSQYLSHPNNEINMSN
ncbi:uncharacterized protein LOC143621898 [Bidens hawaiensis]|uniref:uncharacterized protein LOC143621898 n=1 Tax=Bidens hawaiensis TaxID=980011 RepID=UPI00404AB90D